jgi:catechol 2,3-dioxygenase-like lactoylglutathione lyase family enzyme
LKIQSPFDIFGDYFMPTNYPINPRVRAFGKARIDIAEHAKNPADWEKLWKPASNSFPFVWGESWKQCVEYRVDDFAAEIGFFIDILGLPVNAFDPGYAMFTSPQGDFFFAVVPTLHGESSTSPDAIRLQFMVSDVFATTRELEKRGIAFEQPPQPLRPGSSLSIGYFRTPHGICIELWGMVKASPSSDLEMSLPKSKKNGDEKDDEDDDDELEEDDFGHNGDEDAYGEDDDLVADQDDDEAEDDFEEDDDENEDEFDQDEISSTLKPKPQKDNLPTNPELPQDTKSRLQDKTVGEQKALPLEYIDLDIP